MSSIRWTRTAWKLAALICGLASGLAVAGKAALADPIAIANIERDSNVDFQSEVLPILRSKCLACHNSTDAESELILETPTSIIKGGANGGAVVPGKPEESLLLKLASHQDEPVMPPDDNDVGAKNLTSDELGLIRLWIQQGAEGQVTTAAEKIQWQPLPPGVNPIYAMSVSGDGQYVAAGRANQIFLYHVPSRREVGRLTDPSLNKDEQALPGVAHLDLVQALAFHPNEHLLASGGFRTAKLWRRPVNPARDIPAPGSPPQRAAMFAAAHQLAISCQDGSIQIVDATSGKLLRQLAGLDQAAAALSISATDQWVAAAAGSQVRLWDLNQENGQAWTLQTTTPVHAIAVLEEPLSVATAEEDGKIRIWQVTFDKPEAATEENNSPDDNAAEAKGEESKDEKADAPAEPEPVKPIAELAGHNGPVRCLTLVPGQARQLLSGGEDGKLHHWNLDNNQSLRQFNHGAPVAAIAVRPDAKAVASVGGNASARLWDLSNGNQLAELKGDYRVRLAAAESKREAELAKRHVDLTKQDLEAAKKRKEAEDANVKKADEEKGKAEMEFAKKTEEAKAPVAADEAAKKSLAEAQAMAESLEKARQQSEATVASTGQQLASIDAALQFVAQAAGGKQQQLQEAEAQLAKARQEAEAKADDKSLAEAVAAAEAQLEQARQQQAAATQATTIVQQALDAAKQANQQASEALAEQQKQLAAATQMAKDAEEQVKKTTEPAEKAVAAQNVAEQARDAAVRALDRAKELADKVAQEITQIETTVTQTEQRQQQVQAASEEADKAVPASEATWTAVAFAGDGASLATADERGRVFTWDAANGTPFERFQGSEVAARYLAFDSNQDLLHLAQDGSLRTWDCFAQWTLQLTIGAPESPDILVDRVTALAFSRDGSLLATGSGEPSRSGQLRIWRVESGELVQDIPEAHSDSIFGLEFSRSGDLISSCGADRFVKLFEVATGEHVRSFEGHTHHVLGVDFSADERTLVSCGADQVVKVWDALTGDQKRTIPGFAKEVTAIRFVSISNDVLTSCGDPSVLIKRTDNGNNVRGFGGTSDYVYCADISDDGETIAAGGHASIVRIWNSKGESVVVFDPPSP